METVKGIGSSVAEPLAGQSAAGVPSTWSLMQRSEPLRRYGAQVAYDSVHHELVLFGGFVLQGASVVLVNDTWTYRSGVWRQQQPATSPPVRYLGGMTFDPATQQVLLFGGTGCGDPTCTAGVALSDTWTWDGSNWTQRLPMLSPAPRYDFGIAGDAAHGRTVVFGGCNVSPGAVGTAQLCTGVSDDTWTWDGTMWTPQVVTVAPSARAGSGMVYDATHHDVVLFGGGDAVAIQHEGREADSGDTWSWNGTAWTQLSPAQSPTARDSAGMTYDASRGGVVLFGGFDDSQASAYINAYRNDSWFWDGTTWSPLTPQQSTPPTFPPLTFSPGFAYDSDSGLDVLVSGQMFEPAPFSCGGCGTIYDERDTWLLTGTTWAPRPPTEPDEGGAAAMAYDPQTGTDILLTYICEDWSFGHLDCGGTWSWDGARWTALVPPSAAASPFATATAWDSVDQRLIADANGSTFAFDGTTWSHLAAAAPFHGEARISMSTDVTGRPIVFGGGNDSAQNPWVNTTYRWNGTSWDLLSTASAPSPRFLVQMAYDPTRHVTVLFGGWGCGGTVPSTSGCSSGYYNDTWTWDGSNWTQPSPAASPPARAFGVLVNDPGIEGDVLFGGDTCTDADQECGANNDTWTWDGSNWTQPSPTVSPGNLLYAAAAPLPPLDTAALWGGQLDNPGRVVSDTWLIGALPAANVPEAPSALLLVVSASLCGVVRTMRSRRRRRQP